MPTPKLNRYLGRRRDYHDPRDYIWRAGSHLMLGQVAPTSVDVCAGLAMPPAYEQGDLGSCTANAGARFRRWLGLKFPQYSPPDCELSRLFLYYQERKLDNDTADDSGSGSREIFQVLKSIGVCPETDDPYSVVSFADPSLNDSAKDIQDAAAWKIGAYHRLVTPGDLKACLLSGYAFTLGFTVYSSFEDIGGDGIWSPDPASEEILGGHEVFGRGFDDSVNGGSFLIDNSWGPTWGLNGSFWMPYAFLENYAASQFDSWTGHMGPPWTPKAS